jgi:hypothetical protein
LKQNASGEAKLAIEILQNYFARIKTIKNETKKLTFAERVKIREEKGLEGDFLTLLREIRSFTEFELLSKLTEEEAAKRLAIGTVVGKYHKEALKCRGLTVEDFSYARNNFVEIIESQKVDLAKSSQEPSVISMQN